MHIEAIRKPHVIGYVTKYLTKSLFSGEKGVRQEEREGITLHTGAEGKVVEERHSYTVDLVSKARRIRYSRHFFPQSVAVNCVRVCSRKSSRRRWNKLRICLWIACKRTTIHLIDESSVKAVEQEVQAETSEQPVTEEVPDEAVGLDYRGMR